MIKRRKRLGVSSWTCQFSTAISTQVTSKTPTSVTSGAPVEERRPKQLAWLEDFVWLPLSRLQRLSSEMEVAQLPNDPAVAVAGDSTSIRSSATSTTNCRPQGLEHEDHAALRRNNSRLPDDSFKMDVMADAHARREGPGRMLSQGSIASATRLNSHLQRSSVDEDHATTVTSPLPASHRRISPRAAWKRPQSSSARRPETMGDNDSSAAPADATSAAVALLKEDWRGLKRLQAMRRHTSPSEVAVVAHQVRESASGASGSSGSSSHKNGACGGGNSASRARFDPGCGGRGAAYGSDDEVRDHEVRDDDACKEPRRFSENGRRWSLVRSVVKLGATVRARRQLSLREWAAHFGWTHKRLALTVLYTCAFLNFLAHVMLLAVLPFYVCRALATTMAPPWHHHSPQPPQQQIHRSLFSLVLLVGAPRVACVLCHMQVLDLGGSSLDVGLVTSLFALFQGGATFTAAKLSDQIADGRKPMLLVAFAGCAIGHALTATAPSLRLLLLGRAVRGQPLHRTLTPSSHCSVGGLAHRACCS